MTIIALVVEDFGSIRRGIIRELSKVGIECLDAENGEIALGILRSNGNINIIITDIEMPVMDGYSFISKIYKSPEYKKFRNIPIFIFSGGVDTDSDESDNIIRVSKSERFPTLIEKVKRKLEI